MNMYPKHETYIGPEESCKINEFCTTCGARNSCEIRKGFYSQTRTAFNDYFSNLRTFLDYAGYPMSSIEARVELMKLSLQRRSTEEFRLCNLAEECLRQYDCITCPNCATCTFKGLLLKPEEIKYLHSSITDNPSAEPIISHQLIGAIQSNQKISTAINERAWLARCKVKRSPQIFGVSYNVYRMQLLDNLIKAIRSTVDIHGDE